ncbi:MAG TPA: hypothetical protein VHW01_04720 [Polyangiaceae bacterium]|nr:hypothetical protein [Polyangiaceae bacterium]
MQNKHADKLSFRDWLVQQLKVSCWGSVKGESQQDLAKRLGVTVEVLEQADDELAEEFLARGKVPRRLGRRAFNRSDYAPIAVTMPAAVHAAWTEFYETLRITPSALLRSLIHHFLLTKQRPRTIGKRWVYKRQHHTIKPKGRLHAKTRITRGARIALDHYAEAWNTTATGIVRGLVSDMLEGRALPARLRVIAFAEMWGDPARYWDGLPSESLDANAPKP